MKTREYIEKEKYEMKGKKNVWQKKKKNYTMKKMKYEMKEKQTKTE